ncbi:MAG: glycoside hydrolase domain-containing protein, partial [Promethearchaeota archaeon]
LAYISILATFFILTFTVYGARAQHKYSIYYKKGKLSHLKVSIFGFMDALKFLGLFLVISQILYFFDYPIYFPIVVSWYLLFGIIGALIYLTLGRTQKVKNVLYIFAILLLVLNFYLTFIDGINNAKNYYDGSFDIIFPFTYLHSLWNFLIVGICVGIILSDLFLNFALKHTDGTDSSNRAVFIVFASFVGGMFMMLGNWLINNPGGDPPLTYESYNTFFLICLIFSFILLTGLIFHLFNENFIPWMHKKKRNKLKKKITVDKKKEIIFKSQNQINEKISNEKKIFAIFLCAIVVLSILGGIAIVYTYRENYKKPLLAYSPGNYYIWLQNSSERVPKNVMISVDSSPIIDRIEINLAKNEYYAFQLVWRPLGKPIEDLTYEISDFNHRKSKNITINSNCCSLRYEEYVIEEEFPDVLIPFNKIDLDKKQNYVFWFSIKTPYNILEGKYDGEIEFSFNDNEVVTIKIRLNIWNFAVPKMRHLRTNIGWTRGTHKQITNYFFHRMNDYGVPILSTTNYENFKADETITCFLNESSNNWLFNWTWWDNLTQYKLTNGMNAFTVQYPLGIGGGPAGNRDPYIEDETRMLRLQNWLSDVQNHMEIKNWLNYSYYYFIDEFQMFIPEGYTRDEYFDRLETLLEKMKEAAPKIKIMTTAPPTEELKHLRKYIDIFCPVSYDRDKERWDERLDAGCEFWMYACVGPMAPYPNSHLYNRLYECRILLWQVWLYKLHGFLYWASQAYYHGRYGLAYNGWGDGWFIYEYDSELYDSLRWENYLDAQEDYEYLWLLNATLYYLQKNPDIISEKKLKNLKSAFNEIVNSIVGEKWNYCDHPSTLYNGRERIGNILDDLSNDVNLTTIGENLWLPPYK